MRRPRRENNTPLSLRFIADWQDRVLKQKQLIAHLKEQGQPTTKAEAMLKQYETTLMGLRTHSELMRGLLKPDNTGLNL